MTVPNEANGFLASTGKRIVAESCATAPVDDMPCYHIYSPLTNFSTPTAGEIKEEIASLKNGKAPDIGGFTGQILIKILDFFVPILRHSMGLIFQQERYPTVPKRASVIVVHKKGDAEDLSNYRPISLLSKCSQQDHCEDYGEIRYITSGEEQDTIQTCKSVSDLKGTHRMLYSSYRNSC